MGTTINSINFYGVQFFRMIVCLSSVTYEIISSPAPLVSTFLFDPVYRETYVQQQLC